MNVVVTGASSGIGYAVVKEFVKQGARIVYVISRNKEKLNQLKAECSNIGETNVLTIPMDLCELNVQELNEIIKGNTIDILINNAGYLVKESFQKISIQQLERVYKTNLYAPFLLIQNLLPNLMQSKSPHIVNIGSIGGVQGSSKFSGLSAYSSSKAAVAGLTECLAEELKEYSIKVNCLALGSVNTEMLAAAFPGYQANLSPSQIAEYIVHFSINDHKYINGKIIPVSSTTP